MKVEKKRRDAQRAVEELKHEEKKENTNLEDRLNEERYKQEMRNRHLEMKFKRSENTIKDYKAKIEKKHMLEKEIRRLRENDMQIVKKRQKRLDLREKHMIMNKEKNSDVIIA